MNVRNDKRRLAASLLALPVIGAVAFAIPAVTHAQPATTSPATKPAFVITIDTSDAPHMAAYGERVQVLADAWYPRIVAELASDGFVAPARVRIVFKREHGALASASGDVITCRVAWFEERPEDIGAIVHELVHVAQAYRRNGPPSWVTEGIADHVRWFWYEPPTARPRPGAADAKHDASYRTSAAFMEFARARYDRDLVKKLNAASRQGKYNREIWQQLTGRSLDELQQEWTASLERD